MCVAILRGSLGFDEALERDDILQGNGEVRFEEIHKDG